MFIAVMDKSFKKKTKHICLSTGSQQIDMFMTGNCGIILPANGQDKENVANDIDWRPHT